MNNFIILGASNVTLALPLICRILLQYNESSVNSSGLNLLVAAGHGRSYCGSSSVFGRKLPSIVECNIWDAIEDLHSRNTTTRSLITDIGNDLLYGFSPDEIIASVTVCLERLLLYCKNTDIVVSLPPLQTLETLGAFRYHCARSVLFPFRKHESLSHMMEKVFILQDGLLALEKQFNIRILRPLPAWYGIDPIHIKRKERLSAWEHILGFLERLEFKDKSDWPTIMESVRIYLQKPDKRKMLGFEQCGQQPCLSFNNDKLLYLY